MKKYHLIIIEIISRQSKKKISIKKINSLTKIVKERQIHIDLKNIKSKKNNFANLDFQKITKYNGYIKYHTR